MIIKHFDPFASSKVAPHLLQVLTKIKQVEKSILRWTWSWELYVNMIEKFILKMLMFQAYRSLEVCFLTFREKHVDIF